MNLRLKAKQIVKNNPNKDTKKCIDCICRDIVYGRIWCNAIDDYKTKDYDCPKETNEFLYKCCSLMCMLKNKGITNMTWEYDYTVSYIEAFGYKEVITPENIDLLIKDFDEFYKKWYSRWVEYFNEELQDNKNDNRGW